MAKKTEISVEERLRALYDLQLIDAQIDKIRSVRGELPLEVEDLEDDVAGLTKRVENTNTEIKAYDDEIKVKKNAIETSKGLIKKYGEQQENVRNNRAYESLNKEIEYFIQVNIGNEIQKSGIPVSDLDPFYNYCVNEINLKISGLMVIPPNDNNPEKYFKSLNEINKSLGLQELSMGMSADYIEAIKYGATFVRVGSSIFGERS